MPAAYDNYDYPKYWKGRDYEHKSEEVAIKYFLKKIKKIKHIIDIGCGFGRLTPIYEHRAKYITLTDPSNSLLKTPRKKYKNRKNTKIVQSKLENLPQKFRKNSFDTAIMVRVMHHIENPEVAIKNLSHLVKPNGYIILEFANKLHGKALIKHILKGDLTFPMELEKTDRRCHENIESKTIGFYNFHPDTIREILKENNFKIIEERSVSNIRSTWAKKHIPIEILIGIETLLQNLLKQFGPSVFILAKKTS